MLQVDSNYRESQRLVPLEELMRTVFQMHLSKILLRVEVKLSIGTWDIM